MTAMPSAKAIECYPVGVGITAMTLANAVR